MSMFGDKKEDDKGLPDLPPLKARGMGRFPSHNHVDREVSSLPSFPDSANRGGFSQAAIKDAINREEQEGHYGKSFGVVEMKEWQPGMQEDEEETLGEPGTPELERMPLPRESEFQRMPRNYDRGTIEIPKAGERSGGDVFVKIDKFNSARKTLVEVQEKLIEIDDLIKRIRETKMREEQELGGWEADLMTIKSQIQDVSENIFEKV